MKSARMLLLSLFAIGSASSAIAGTTLQWGGYSWTQEDCPNAGSEIRSGVPGGATFNTLSSGLTGSITQFPASVSGGSFDANIGVFSVLIGQATAPNRNAVNLPYSPSVNQAIDRRGLSVGWLGGTVGGGGTALSNPTLPNGPGADFVIFESGSAGVPEAMMVRVHVANDVGGPFYSRWYYAAPVSETVTTGGERLHAYEYDLDDFGLPSDAQIDRIEVANMVASDRIDAIGAWNGGGSPPSPSGPPSPPPPYNPFRPGLGMFGGAAEFRGNAAGDFATFSSPLFNVGAKGTLNLWVKLDDTSRRNQLIEGPNNQGFEFQYRSNGGGQFYGRATTEGGDFVIQAGPAGATATSWTNLQYTWNATSGEMHIRMNGVEVSYVSGFDAALTGFNNSTATDTTLAEIFVGRDPGELTTSPVTRFLDGMMDDLAWFDDVLSPAELDAIRTGGVSTLAADSRLVAHWDFDSISGTTEVDNKNGIVLNFGQAPANTPASLDWVAEGFVLPEKAGEYTMANPGPDPGPYASFTIPYGNSTYDPDPLYLASLHNLQELCISPSCAITAATAVPAYSTGNAASVASAGVGATYAWSVTGGTITAGQGTSAITYNAGSGSSVTLDVVVTLNGCSCAGQAVVAIGSGPGTLDIRFDRPCYKPGDTITAIVSMKDLGTPAAGFQAFLAYDAARLNFTGWTYSASPFGLPVLNSIGLVNPVPGELDLASGIQQIGAPGQSPTLSDADLVTLTFSYAGAESCSAASLLGFRAHTPPTRITDVFGNSLAPLVTMDPPSIVIDGVGPVVTTASIAACYPTAAAAENAALGATSASDNCTADDDLVTTVSTAGDCDAVITVVVEDCAGNATSVQYFTRIDSTPPVAVSNRPIAACYPDIGAVASAALLSTSVTDNCDGPLKGSVSITGDCDALVVVTYVDGCMNTSNQIIYHTRIDSVAPEITCPAAATVECDGSLDPIDTGMATASDNCDASPVITYTDAPSLNGCGGYTGAITRTWVATDSCGNTASCNQTITVEDTTDPVITCPADVTVECDESIAPANTGTATAIDNCDGATTIAWSDSPDLSGCGGYTGTITRTWIATDACGNSTACDQTITVADTTPPVVNCPPTATISCEDAPDPMVTGIATADDACDAAPAVSHFDCPRNTVLDAPSGWQFYTTNTAAGAMVAGPSAPPAGGGSFRATTGSGNGSGMGGKVYLGTRNHNGVLLSDITDLRYSTFVSNSSTAASHLATAIDIYVDLDGNGTRDTTLVFEPVYATLQGPVVKGVWQQWDTLTSENTWWYTAPFGPLTMNGNQFKPLSYYIGLFPNARIVDFGCDPGFQFVSGQSSGGIWAGFDGNIDNLIFNVDQYDFESDACLSDRIERVWIGTDVCGNVGYCVQNIDFVDTTAPDLTCPSDVTSFADAGQCSALVNVGVATATDNCGDPVTITAERSDNALLTLADPFPVGTTTVTWTATDGCGNASSCEQMVTVTGFSELLVSVQLSPTVVAGPFDRCITFQLIPADCISPPVIVEEVMTFTNGLAANQTLLVPCGSYACMTARDRLHTLRSTDDDDFTVMGTQFVADFTNHGGLGGDDDRLIGGNLNDDAYIDILDFGAFAGQFNASYGTADTTCSTTAVHADISGDGIVFTGDFTFIQINFLKFREADCCGSPLIQEPVTNISLDELQARGMGRLAVADLNGDGWLNQQDVAAFMQGVRPKKQVAKPTGGPPRSGVEAIEQAELRD